MSMKQLSIYLCPLISFINVLQFSVYWSSTSLVKLFLGIIPFDGIVNEIVFLITFWQFISVLKYNRFLNSTALLRLVGWGQIWFKRWLKDSNLSRQIWYNIVNFLFHVIGKILIKQTRIRKNISLSTWSFSQLNLKNNLYKLTTTF